MFQDMGSTRADFRNTSDVQVYPMTPVDYLDKMSDEKADLKTFCQNAVLGQLGSNTQYIMMHTKPYIKRYNLTED